MNIRPCLKSNPPPVSCCCCPVCHACHFRKHGFYYRKGFHTRHKDALPAPSQLVMVARFRCLNPECPQRTFSILPPGVLPYCRFYWQDLLDVHHSLSSGLTPYNLAKRIWHVGSAVIRRAMLLLDLLIPWVESQHREVTHGLPAQGLERMVKIITAKIGRHQPVYRWYRHRYPMRCFKQKQAPHNSALR